MTESPLRKKIRVSGTDSKYFTVSRLIKILLSSSFVRRIIITLESSGQVSPTMILRCLILCQLNVAYEVKMTIDALQDRAKSAYLKFDEVWRFL